MDKQDLSGGTVHETPDDLKAALGAAPAAREAWESLTPLARNEWICWTITCKQQETRDKHIERLIADLQKGKRRPCCWMGCVHRTDKEISPSVQWLLGKRDKPGQASESKKAAPTPGSTATKPRSGRSAR